ncbi:hypothetical protein NK718_14755 [Alsobacter sp. SYSU M60028]|uniref:Invasion associated locus B family protein n=1 Tax=Alsobacter ponti TaxID=2962936 RepID=A0ABT1LFQ4_9HYPH|nr:hypothetical protein [Alsobacter ponti]MCP8939786.1 hypothetical protein [Alsobacter ponti]
MTCSLSSSFLASAAGLTLALAVAVGPAAAQNTTKPPATPAKPATATKPGTPAKPAATPAKPAAAAKPPAGAKPAAAAKPSAPGGGQPMLLEKFGDWGAYASDTAKGKVCYALAQPKDRAPATLKRDAGYLFISTRPAEGVRNEVSFVLGFPAKDGGEGSASFGAQHFAIVTKGSAAWVKNAAEDAAFVEAMRRAQSLTVKVSSVRGNESTDRYSLAGATQALDRVRKECP